MEKIMRIGKGYLISLMAFGILTFLGAVAMKLTPFPEDWGFAWVLAAMMLVCLFLGLYMSSYFQKAGMLTGLLFSALLILLILLIVSACFSSFLKISMFSPIYFLPLGCGVVGGILGANFKK